MGGTWVMVDGAEIEVLAGDVSSCADDLDESCRQLRVARWQVDLLGFGPEGALGTLPGVVSAVAEALTAAEGARRAIRGRADAVHAALREYDGADSLVAVERALDLVPALGPPLAPLALPVVGLGGIAADTASAGGLRMRGAWVTTIVRWSGIGTLGRLVAGVGWGPDPVGGMSTWLRAAGLVLPGVVGPVWGGLVPGMLQRLDARIEVDPPTPGSSTAAAGIGDLASRIGVAYDEAPDGAGAVDVQRIEHADGRVSWTVSVPGTQGFGASYGASDVPMAGDVNVAAYLGMQGPPDALVLAAMEQAGIGPDEPVVLAGHSLAGMVVMHLATSPAVTERYTVAAVVTFGSPVGHLPPASVPTLHVRHAEDGTPSLSGVSGSRHGGPAPGEVVVVKELGGDPVMGVAHAIGGYEETARELEADRPLGLTAWEDATKDLFAGEGDTVTSTLHVGRVG